MTQTEINACLIKSGYQGFMEAPEQLRAWFCLQMRERQYGGEALLDAWLWYRTGWGDSRGALIGTDAGKVTRGR